MGPTFKKKCFLLYFMSVQVPPPPGSGTNIKFEIVPEAGEGGQSSGDRTTVYKRLQQELIQQTRVGVVRLLIVHDV